MSIKKKGISLYYIPSYMHVRPDHREKLADLQGTLKLHLQFYDRTSRSHRPRNEIDMHIILCVHTVWL